MPGTIVGRSLRLLLGVGLGLAVWLALRLPVLERDMAALHAAPAPLLPTAEAPPLPAATANARFLPVAAVTGAAAARDVAVAEVAVAQAALELAQARLRLVQIEAGMPVARPHVSVRPEPIPGPAYRWSYAPRVAAAPRVAHNPVMLAMAASAVPADPAATAVPPPQAAPAPAPLPASLPAGAGHDLATAAYARLSAGDRRGAVALFDAALATDPVPEDATLRPVWTAERRRLVRRWSGDAYTLLRDPGPAGPAASPVLGGGQSGGTLAWTLDPLARRPLAVVARYNAASRGGNIDPATGQAAFGVRWQPLKGVSLSAERLVSIGVFSRDDWALRLAGGAEGKRGQLVWSGYGEAGVLGAGDVFAGAQLRAGLPVVRLGKVALLAGPGAWASIQHGSGFTTGRVDVGPTLVLRAPLKRLAIDVSADWRFRAAGNASPGSGPALTISTGF
jgi:hypothetical protein